MFQLFSRDGKELVKKYLSGWPTVGSVIPWLCVCVCVYSISLCATDGMLKESVRSQIYLKQCLVTLDVIDSFL